MNADLAAQRALDRLRRDGWAALTATDKTVAAVWLFTAGVGNIGFAGYFSSSRSDHANCTPAALRAIGAEALAGLAEAANGVFVPDGPPSDRAVRRAAVAALPPAAHETLAELDRKYLACDEDPDELLEAFLQTERKIAGE